MDRGSVGPLVSMHELAASLWLRTGLYEKSEIPRRKLLVGCERVLAIKSQVVTQAKRAILRLKKGGNISEELGIQIEAVMQQDRSLLLVSDYVRGAQHNLTELDLLETYNRVLADEYDKGIYKGKTEIRAERDQLSEQVKTLEERLLESKAEIEREKAQSELKSKMLRERDAAIEADKRNRVYDLLFEINSEIKRRRFWLIGVLLVSAACLLAASMWKEFTAFFGQDIQQGSGNPLIGNWLLFLCGSLPALVTFADQCSKLFFHFRPLDWLFIERWARNRTIRLAQERGVIDLLLKESRDAIKYSDGCISVRPFEK